MSPAIQSPLTDRELRWLSHIGTHGPQSSELLYALTRPTHRCKDTSLRTLQRLRRDGYLRLPDQQRSIAKADFNPYVYDLTPLGQANLTGIGAAPSRYRPTGHWWHRFQTACVSSAFAIQANRAGIGYLAAGDILKAGQVDAGIRLERRRVLPDQIFALRYEAGFRLCALEVDRGTEPLHSKAARKSVTRMIEHYAAIQENALHRDAWNVQSPLLVLLAFAHPARAVWSLDRIAGLSHKSQAAFLVQTTHPGFPRWHDLRQAVSAPWRRAGHPDLQLL